MRLIPSTYEDGNTSLVGIRWELINLEFSLSKRIWSAVGQTTKGKNIMSMYMIGVVATVIISVIGITVAGLMWLSRRSSKI